MIPDPPRDPLAPMDRLAEGALAQRLLPGGAGELCVYPLLFGAARLTFGRDPKCPFGYDDCWDYPNSYAAFEAMVCWDGHGEPDGWTRHPTRWRPKQGVRAAMTDPPRDPLATARRLSICDVYGHDLVVGHCVECGKSVDALGTNGLDEDDGYDDDDARRVVDT